MFNILLIISIAEKDTCYSFFFGYRNCKRN